MSQEKPQRIGDIIARVFLKVFWILVVAGILYSCIDKNTQWLKPDYSQPHEYLSISGYGQSGEILDGNDHVYSGIGLRQYKDNFFRIGRDECTAYLNRISEEKVKLSMREFNILLGDKGDFNDVRVAHAKLQCVEFLGRDKACEDQVKNLAKQAKSPQSGMLIMLEFMAGCRSEQSIGEYRVISLGQ